MTRPCGWAKRGKPCSGCVPGNSGRRHSLAALFSVEGILCHRLQGGSLKQSDFLAFVEEQVVPQLRQGDVLVLDNARCHHGKAVQDAVESAGARLLFLPAYSPDFAPIELAWRQVKTFLRKEAPRTVADLQAAVEPAMQQVTPGNAQAFYRHCGYQTLQTQ